MDAAGWSEVELTCMQIELSRPYHPVHALCVGMNGSCTQVFLRMTLTTPPIMSVYTFLPSAWRHLPHPHCRERHSGYHKANSLSISMVTSCVFLLDHHNRRHSILSSCHNHSVRRYTLNHAFMFQQSTRLPGWQAYAAHTQNSELIQSMCVNVPTTLGTYVPGVVHYDVKRRHCVHSSAGPWFLSSALYVSYSTLQQEYDLQ